MATLSCRVETNHRDVIHDAKLNYYGTRLATCSSDRSIKVFDVKPNGQTFPLAELAGHSGPVWQLSWAHPKFDGVLASASYDKKVVIWQEVNGRYQKSFEWTQNGHEASVNGLEFAPHQFGLILATASSDASIGILTFDAATSQWSSTKIIKAHDQGVNAVSWAPAIDPLTNADGPKKRIVSCGNDKNVKIWKCKDDGEWALEHTLQGHSDFVRDVAWCPVVNHNVHTIVSCGQDRSALIYRCSDLNKGEWTTKLLERTDGALWHVNWSVCGTILSISGEDNKAILWKENLQNAWTRIDNDEDTRRR